ncbi:MAG TPA: sulfatase-like hydrolase/transferase [Armatimonadota bacterium]|nr:sulfatase-like hydrolase/transferase [Armatimonadota bacterium]
MSHVNVLVIFTDQQRADTIHALGNPVIRTPNLDRLCAEGVSFTSAFSASPVCVPARCALHYGQYPQRSSCYDNGDPMPEDGRLSFMEALAQAGYRTHGIGKCHFTPDRFALRGFQARERQEELLAAPAEDDYLQFLQAHGFAHIGDPHGVRGEMYYVPQPAQMPAELHPTQWVGDRARTFITEQAGSPQPWLLFCSFIHPHPPFSPPSPWHKLYRAPLMPLPHVPADWEALHTAINRVQNRYKYRDQGFDQNLVRCLKAYYYAAISFIDFQVGRIVQALEQSGHLERTLVIFTSDHGELLGDYRCFGKRSMHDACARVPMLARLPGRFPAGLRCASPVSLVDVMPTMLAAADIPGPSTPLDGEDLAAVAAGRSPRQYVYSQYQRAAQAIYTIVGERWKYAYSAPDNREYLFDRQQDPLESRNLAEVHFAEAARRQMREQIIGYLRSAGEADALDGDDWRTYPRHQMPANPDAGLLVQDTPWADTRIDGYT